MKGPHKMAKFESCMFRIVKKLLEIFTDVCIVAVKNAVSFSISPYYLRYFSRFDFDEWTFY